MIERNGYAGFSAFPAEAGTVGPHRPIDALTQSTRVTLSGNAFTVRVQISNAQSQTAAPHLFVPPDDSFETFATLTPPAAPLSIPGPARFVRLIVDSGEVTDAHIEESQVDAWGANLEAVTLRAEGASTFALGAIQALDDGASGLLALANATQQALDNLADSQADLEQTAALATAAAGITGKTNLAAITGADGYYRAMDTGYVYQRTAGVNTRRPALEALNQDSLTNRLIAETLNAVGYAPGLAAGDSKLYLGRTYYWNPDSTETVSAGNPTVLQTAGGGVGRWIMADREWGLNLKWFEYLVVNGDWIPAVKAALVIDSVYIPDGIFIVKPSATNTITFPLGKSRTLSGSGAGSVLKVADGNGAYPYLIGQSTADRVLDIRLARFKIDQNYDNVTGGIIPGDLATAQNAIRFNKFAGVDVDDVTFNGTGINTITINGQGGVDNQNATRASVRNNHLTWGRNASNVVFDNSAIYVNAYDMKIIDNTLTARSVLDGAWGAIEAHGAQGVVSRNTITNFRDTINLTTFSGSDPETNLTSSLLCADNVATGGGVGIRLWIATGKTMRNVQIINNILVMDQGQWPALNFSAGVVINYSPNGDLDGDLDGALIQGNTIKFAATETRTTGLAYASCAGIGLAGNGNVYNVRAYDNSVTNAQFYAFIIGRPGKTVQNLRMANNVAHNNGTATGHAPSQARAILTLQGLLKNVRISRLSVTEDTATAQATALLTTALTVGSDVTFDNVDITAPNNPALIIPVSPPTGVTFATLGASLTAANTWTAAQAFNAGLTATALGTPVTGTQSGTATGSVGAPTVQLTRSVTAGANNVTGSTFRLNDAATVTTGTRFNALFELQWDGTAKFLVSGASHAMGAGIITTGGWARASANLTPGSIAVGAWWESADIAVTGVVSGDDVRVAPSFFTPLGLLAVGIVSGAGQVRVRLKNDTASPYTPTAGAAWKIAVFRS